MSTVTPVTQRDAWFVEPIDAETPAHYRVLDENRLEVAYCGSRQEDAERIAKDHNDAEELRIAAYDMAALLNEYSGDCDNCQRLLNRDDNAEPCELCQSAKRLIDLYAPREQPVPLRAESTPLSSVEVDDDIPF